MLVYVQMMDSRKEQDLFTQIYMAYRGQMMEVAKRYLKEPQDAEDAVHQAFLYVAENFSKFSEGVCPKTRSYIVKVTESRAIDILRRQAKYVSMDAYEQQLQEIAVPESASDLARNILQLPERYRNALILRYAYGYEFREIGKLMNMKEEAARRLVTRARTKLEKICRKEGVL